MFPPSSACISRLTNTLPCPGTTSTSSSGFPSANAQAMRLQGNTLWIPSVLPESVSQDGCPNVLINRRLLLHAAGPIMDRLHLSWLNQEVVRGERVEQEQRQHHCWMSGGIWANGEVGGRIRQIVPLNEETYDPHGWDYGEAALPSFFVRGATNASLFRLDSKTAIAKEGTDLKESPVPYAFCPLQNIQVSMSSFESPPVSSDAISSRLVCISYIYLKHSSRIG